MAPRRPARVATGFALLGSAHARSSALGSEEGWRNEDSGAERPEGDPTDNELQRIKDLLSRSDLSASLLQDLPVPAALPVDGGNHLPERADGVSAELSRGHDATAHLLGSPAAPAPPLSEAAHQRQTQTTDLDQLALEIASSPEFTNRGDYMQEQDAAPALSPTSANCTWRYYNQPLDHFAGKTYQSNFVFEQRVCFYEGFASTEQRKESERQNEDEGEGDLQRSRSVATVTSTTQSLSSPAPAASTTLAAPSKPFDVAFFYVGNESPLEVYINNTGLMWNLGRKMRAALIFAEHRYEGESVPKNLNNTKNCLAYASSKQALADYALLIETLKKFDQNYSKTTKFIAFGGSYGGMLAAWMRTKYPHLVQGAIAGSAPIYGIPTFFPQIKLDSSAVTIARGLMKPGGLPNNDCAEIYQIAWLLLQYWLAETKHGGEEIQKAMKLCTKPRPKDSLALLTFLQSAFFLLAEGNYPFPSDYITGAVGGNMSAKLPAWPMRKSCSNLLDGFKPGGQHYRKVLKLDREKSSSSDGTKFNVTIFSGKEGAAENDKSLDAASASAAHTAGIISDALKQHTKSTPNKQPLPVKASSSSERAPSYVFKFQIQVDGSEYTVDKKTSDSFPEQIASELLERVSAGVAVWYNVTERVECLDWEGFVPDAEKNDHDEDDDSDNSASSDVSHDPKSSSTDIVQKYRRRATRQLPFRSLSKGMLMNTMLAAPARSSSLPNSNSEGKAAATTSTTANESTGKSKKKLLLSSSSHAVQRGSSSIAEENVENNDVCLYNSNDPANPNAVPGAFSWGPTVCNDQMFLVNTISQGFGRDKFFWPPTGAANLTELYGEAEKPIIEVTHENENKAAGAPTQQQQAQASTPASPCSQEYAAQHLYGLAERNDFYGQELFSYYGMMLESSNIIFSNGLLDPWIGGGVSVPQDLPPYQKYRGKVVYPVKKEDEVGIAADGGTIHRRPKPDDLLVALIEKGAHHLDLMFPSKGDPLEVKYIRYVERKFIEKWTKQHVEQEATELPVVDSARITRINEKIDKRDAGGTSSTKSTAGDDYLSSEAGVVEEQPVWQ
ncbi:unnamed protein product [Amoebophrya sp. A120]|nr:unnamed protein product [Amoebophrya sp. A120]|eukprot:GSA120T00021998001.1